MTGNDLRGDGWQETRMRKPEHSGCGGYESRSWPASAAPTQPQKAGARKDMQSLDGGFLLSKNNPGIIKLQAFIPNSPTFKERAALYLYAD